MPEIHPEPSVSVIIPCHNHAKYIGDAIKSVTSQDYPNKNLVIIDDGSTDNSYEQVCKLIEIAYSTDIRDPNGVLCGQHNNTMVYLLYNEQPQKQAAARNRGIKFALQTCKPSLIGVLDADDRYLQSKLSKSIEAWKKHPKHIGLVYSDVLIEHETTNKIIHEFRIPFDRAILERECIVSNAPLINAEVFSTVGFYEESLPPCEDWDLWLRITERYMAIHIPEPLQVYRVTGFNCTFTVPQSIWHQQWYRVQQRLMERKK